jgi:hypothetical protein
MKASVLVPCSGASLENDATHHHPKKIGFIFVLVLVHPPFLLQ